jgi:hypothetical protein
LRSSANSRQIREARERPRRSARSALPLQLIRQAQGRGDRARARRQSIPAAFNSEDQAISFIPKRVAKGTLLDADEAPSWNALHARFEVKRINHQEAYSHDGACTNAAEGFFSRMRRGEIGHHHHIAGVY